MRCCPVLQPPRPPELPGLMHTVSMTSYLATKGNVEQLLLEWRQKYGPYFEFQIPGSPPVMVVCHPDAIREVSRLRLMNLASAESCGLCAGAVVDAGKAGSAA